MSLWYVKKQQRYPLQARMDTWLSFNHYSAMELRLIFPTMYIDIVHMHNMLVLLFSLWYSVVCLPFTWPARMAMMKSSSSSLTEEPLLIFQTRYSTGCLALAMHGIGMHTDPSLSPCDTEWYVSPYHSQREWPWWSRPAPSWWRSLCWSFRRGIVQAV